MCQISHKIVYCFSHIYTCDTYLHPLSEPNDESKTPEIPSSLVALLEPQRRFLSTIPEISENNSSDQGDDSVFGRQGLTYILMHACMRFTFAKQWWWFNFFFPRWNQSSKQEQIPSRVGILVQQPCYVGKWKFLKPRWFSLWEKIRVLENNHS